MKNTLEECGFSKNESLIYITLSKIGISTAYKVSKETGLFKANTYEILKKLFKKRISNKRKNKYDWENEEIINRKNYRGQEQQFVIAKFIGKKENIKPDDKEIRKAK